MKALARSRLAEEMVQEITNLDRSRVWQLDVVIPRYVWTRAFSPVVCLREKHRREGIGVVAAVRAEESKKSDRNCRMSPALSQKDEA